VGVVALGKNAPAAAVGVLIGPGDNEATVGEPTMVGWICALAVALFTRNSAPTGIPTLL
jgi:hypothetical protein